MDEGLRTISAYGTPCRCHWTIDLDFLITAVEVEHTVVLQETHVRLLPSNRTKNQSQVLNIYAVTSGKTQKRIPNPEQLLEGHHLAENLDVAVSPAVLSPRHDDGLTLPTTSCPGALGKGLP